MIGRLRGRYGDTGDTPYIETLITLPSQGINGGISFIFDTGASQTLLMPIDGIRIGVDYSALDNPMGDGFSASGRIDAFEEQAVLVFSQPKKNQE